MGHKCSQQTICFIWKQLDLLDVSPDRRNCGMSHLMCVRGRGRDRDRQCLESILAERRKTDKKDDYVVFPLTHIFSLNIQNNKNKFPNCTSTYNFILEHI